MDKFLSVVTNENGESKGKVEKSKENIEEPQNHLGKRRREVSFVWDHFKKCAGGQEAICNHCSSKIKTTGNVTNLLHHIKNMHKQYDQLKKCDPKPVSTSSLDKFVNRAKHYENGSARKNAIDEAILRMISIDLQPFSVVEARGFRNVINLLDARYKIPNKKFFRNELLDKNYDNIRERLKLVLKNVAHVSLTADCWTSKSLDGYLTVTCHFINASFELVSAVLTTRKLLTPTNHTAKNISETLLAVMTEWDVNKKVVCIVTDNDATIKKSCELLQIKNFPCFSHTLNLVVQEVLKLPSLNEILLKCKRIVSFFKSSTVANAKLKEAQNVDNPLGVIQEVTTRWNSALFMMQRIRSLNAFIGKVLLDSPKAPLPLSSEEIETISELIDILKPFNDATLHVSGNKTVTVSLIIPMIAELHQKINKLGIKLKSESAIEALKLISKRLPERFAAYEKRTIPRIATLIDPRFKKDGFLHVSNADEAAKALEKEITDKLSSVSSKTPPTPPGPPKRARFEFLQTKISSKASSNRADAIIMMRQYLLKENADEDVNPLHFWQCTDEQILKEVVKKYMCVPATSWESERMFSKAGQLISDRRCSLKPAVVDKILFINRNVDLNLN